MFHCLVLKIMVALCGLLRAALFFMPHCCWVWVMCGMDPLFLRWSLCSVSIQPFTYLVSVGFQKCYVTPCHECCSVQNKQIVVFFYFWEVFIILPSTTLIISLYVIQYFTCLLLEYCTWNDSFILEDRWKLTYLLPVLDSLGFNCKFWIFTHLFIGWELSQVHHRIAVSRMVELVTWKFMLLDYAVTGSRSIRWVRQWSLSG